MKLCLSLFLMCVLLVLTGCDRSVPLTINGKKPYHIETPCGAMDINTSMFSNFISIHQTVRSGEFKINFDSLAMMISSKDSIKIDTIYFNFDKNNLNRKQLPKEKIIRTGELSSIDFVFDKPLYGVSGTLLILPCRYITCQNQELIQDTLRISFGTPLK